MPPGCGSSATSGGFPAWTCTFSCCSNDLSPLYDDVDAGRVLERLDRLLERRGLDVDERAADRHLRAGEIAVAPPPPEPGCCPLRRPRRRARSRPPAPRASLACLSSCVRPSGRAWNRFHDLTASRIPAPSSMSRGRIAARDGAAVAVAGWNRSRAVREVSSRHGRASPIPATIADVARLAGVGTRHRQSRPQRAPERRPADARARARRDPGARLRPQLGRAAPVPRPDPHDRGRGPLPHPPVGRRAAPRHRAGPRAGRRST